MTKIKNKNNIIKDLEFIFEKKLKLSDKTTTKAKQFDSIVILQIINMAKIKYNKTIDGTSISKCKTISEIVDKIS